VTIVAMESQTARSPVIVVGVNTAVRNIQVSSVDGEEQQWVPFPTVVELLNFRTAGTTITVFSIAIFVSVFCRCYPARNSHLFLRCTVSSSVACLALTISL
jgi:hypothetical protein